MNKKLIIVTIVSVILGYFAGVKSKPERVEDIEKISKQSEIITELKLQVKSLTQENLKENIKTVIVEKPDGTKTTTKVRVIEKVSSTVDTSVTDNSKVEKESEKIEKEKITINHSNHNAVGARVSYDFSELSVEPYLKAGTKCFVFECYAEGSYKYVQKEIRITIGIEYRF